MKESETAEFPDPEGSGQVMTQLKIAQVATADVSIFFLLKDQIQALQATGHEVTAVCAPGSRVEEIREQGIPVRTVPMERELSPLKDLWSLLQLFRCFRSERFDVVHTHTPKAGLLGPIAAKMAGVPMVVHTIHGLLYHDALPLWKRLLFWIPEKTTALFSDYLLSQSREDVSVAVRTWLCVRSKISYLGNGVDVSLFAPRSATPHQEPGGREIGRERVVVGSVGRLVYEKGFAELFQAAEALADKYEKLEFVIVGPREVDQNDAVEPGQNEDLEKRGLVRFAGWQRDMPAMYRAMDLFVLPSHREGIPRACMEAAAMGLPVIATDIRGCREVVLDGQTGTLVPAKNAAALTAAIEQLLQRPQDWASMGGRARQHIVENFNNKIVIQRLRSFYARLEGKYSPP